MWEDRCYYNNVEKKCVIAVGPHDNLKLVKDCEVFLTRHYSVVRILEPQTIVIYGAASDKYCKKYGDDGIQILQQGERSMNILEYREVIKRRIYVEEISHGEWAEGIEECWEKEIALLSENILETIMFLRESCTADEYSWISEVLDDVVEKVPSRELVECYKELMTKFPEECTKYNIAGAIESADTILKYMKGKK